MIVVHILEDEDTVEAEDWCRPLLLQTMSGGSSDFMSFKSCYGGTPENNVEWTQVKSIFGECWYGSKVKDLVKRPLVSMEFMRGNPPKHHCLNMKGYTDLTKFRKTPDFE